jgi:hypothetical protein
VCSNGQICDDTSGVCVDPPECTIDTDCDDSDLCTTDVCNAQKQCENTAKVCSNGQICDDTSGVCVDPPQCTIDTDCDDTDLCTTDVCNAQQQCENTAKVCSNGQICDDTSGICVDPVNDLFNGSFEYWTDVLVDNWTVYSELTLEKEDTTIYEGLYSVKLTRTIDASDNALTAIESSSLEVTEGSTYLISSYVFDNSDTVRIRVNYMWLDVNDVQLGASIYGGYSSDGDTWENLTKVTDPAPIGAVYLRVFFRIYNDGVGGNTGSVYLDDVTVVEQ